MKKKTIYCHSEKCKGRAMDDQEIRVISTRFDVVGERWTRLVCDWCGNNWQTASPCDHLPGYKQAEKERQSRDDHEQKHTGYSRYR